MGRALGLPVSAGFTPQNLDAPVPNVVQKKSAGPTKAFRRNKPPKGRKAGKKGYPSGKSPKGRR